MTDQGNRRDRLLDAGILLVIALIAYVVGQGGSAALTGGVTSFAILAPALLASSWLAWLVFIAALGVLAWFGPPGWRRWLVPVSGIAWVAGTLVLSGGAITAASAWGPWLILLVVLAQAPAFILAVVVSVMLVGAITPAASRTVPAAASVVRAAAVGGAVLMTPWFFAQWFTSSFALFGGPRDIAPEAGTRYLVTTVVAVALAVIGLGLAIWERRATAIVGAIATLLVLLIVAFTFQVPPGSVTFPAPSGENGPAPGEPGGGQDPDCAFDASRPGCGG